MHGGHGGGFIGLVILGGLFLLAWALSHTKTIQPTANEDAAYWEGKYRAERSRNDRDAMARRV